MDYRREIDGLRALAVLPVVLFHAGVPAFSGGFVGVDIFFVISGYLITGILLSELDSGRFSIVSFYERRARRILPALFLIMALCIPFAWASMLPSDMEAFSKSVLAVSLFFSNILFYREVGYFSAAADEKPLLHTWSLAVEEQFYIFFPLLLLFIWRYRKEWLFGVLSLLAVMSLLLSEWGWRNNPEANFYLLPARVWELMVGALCAFLAGRGYERPNNAAALVGLTAVCGSIFLYGNDVPSPSVFMLMPVLGAAFIILFGKSGTFVAQILGARVLVAIGLISYSIYLWHQPLFAFSRIMNSGEPHLWQMVLLSVASVVLAYLTWRYVEQPFRNKTSFNRKRIFTLSFLMIALFSFLGQFGAVSEGFKQRFDVPLPISLNQFRLPSRADGYCFYSFNESELPVEKSATFCRLTDEASDDSKLSVLLFGDSFVAQWEPFFKRFSMDHDFTVDSVTTNWCFPAFEDHFTAPRGHKSIEQCRLNRAWVRGELENYDVLVISAAWYQVQEKGFGEDVAGVVDYVLNHTDAKVVIIDTPVLFERRSVEDALYGKEVAVRPERDKTATAAVLWRALERQYADNSRVMLLSKQMMGLLEAIDFKTDDGYPYSLDGKHVSVYGALKLYKSASDNGRLSPMLEFFREEVTKSQNLANENSQ
ncbi:acyltransferase family protein [Thalassolituus sp. LLYu03]|uniref:acyltransferase family protein n=1 Tax=Thalassolituus sp. LLYu03 TaxID=3421656 RepID=UPI003D26D5D6